MLSYNVKSHNIEISKDLIKSVKLARQRYDMYLEDEKKKKEASEKDVLISHLNEDLAKVKTKKGSLEKNVWIQRETMELIDVEEDDPAAKSLQRSCSEMSEEGRWC